MAGRGLRYRELAAVALAAPVVIASCVGGTARPGLGPGPSDPTGMPGALSIDAAISRAIELAPAPIGSATVEWASIMRDPLVPRGTTSDRFVWVVRLHGIPAPTCPVDYLEHSAQPSQPPCVDMEGGVDAVLDLQTGALRGWTQ